MLSFVQLDPAAWEIFKKLAKRRKMHNNDLAAELLTKATLDTACEAGILRKEEAEKMMEGIASRRAAAKPVPEDDRAYPEDR